MIRTDYHIEDEFYIEGRGKVFTLLEPEIKAKIDDIFEYKSVIYMVTDVERFHSSGFEKRKHIGIVVRQISV